MASTNRRKKSKVEVQAYKRSVKSGASLLGSAVGIKNNNLTGSAEIYEEVTQGTFTQEAKNSIRLARKAFLQKAHF